MEDTRTGPKTEKSIFGNSSISTGRMGRIARTEMVHNNADDVIHATRKAGVREAESQ